jgi:hypothetical protein
MKRIRLTVNGFPDHRVSSKAEPPGRRGFRLKSRMCPLEVLNSYALKLTIVRNRIMV